VGGGDVGFVRAGSGSMHTGTVGGAGEERQDRSIASTLGDVCFPNVGCEDNRSTVSTGGEADFVFRSRGEVRLLRATSIAFSELFPFSSAARSEQDDNDDEFEDIEVSGGRVADGWVG
jgi:hypothetical protein